MVLALEQSTHIQQRMTHHIAETTQNEVLVGRSLTILFRESAISHEKDSSSNSKLLFPSVPLFSSEEEILFKFLQNLQIFQMYPKSFKHLECGTARQRLLFWFYLYIHAHILLYTVPGRFGEVFFFSFQRMLVLKSIRITAEHGREFFPYCKHCWTLKICKISYLTQHYQ